MLAAWHWHIEISSKCTLKCPRCARQEAPESLVNTELTLEFFQRNFSPDFVQKNVEKITFCGDDGDPIYAHDLIEIIKYFKNIKPIEITLITNGSYKKPDWWQALGKVLQEQDSVHFSIDGYDNESNNKYRVNSDYDSIILGIKTLRANSICRIIWATIAFKFNEEYLDQIEATAYSLGVDKFQLTKSTKFVSVYPSYGPVDVLEPSQKFISQTHRFEREIKDFTKRSDIFHNINIELFNKHKDRTPVVPLCGIGNKGVYIDSQGRLFPCCWVANRYTHNKAWQIIGTRFDLNKITLQEALDDVFWVNEFQKFEWHECKTKCSSSVVDLKYATTW